MSEMGLCYPGEKGEEWDAFSIQTEEKEESEENGHDIGIMKHNSMNPLFVVLLRVLPENENGVFTLEVLLGISPEAP